MLQKCGNITTRGAEPASKSQTRTNAPGNPLASRHGPCKQRWFCHVDKACVQEPSAVGREMVVVRMASGRSLMRPGHSGCCSWPPMPAQPSAATRGFLDLGIRTVAMERPRTNGPGNPPATGHGTWKQRWFC